MLAASSGAAIAAALSAVNRFYSDIQRQLCQPTDELTMPSPPPPPRETAGAGAPAEVTAAARPNGAAVAAEIRDLAKTTTT